MKAPWQLDLLGGLRVRGAERTITRFRTRKTSTLLAYLALHSERAHPRVQLAEMLWPGSEPHSGRLNLRAELAWLRRQLEVPALPRGAALIANHAEVQLSPRACCTDVAAFEAAVVAARRAEDRSHGIELLQCAVELYRGELLPGYFEDWILRERGRLADVYLAAVRRLSRHLYEAGDPQGAIAAAHQAIAADPLSEEAHFDLICLYAATNRSVDALRQYQVLEQALRKEFGDEPTAEVRRFAGGLAGDMQALHAAQHLNERRLAPSSPPAEEGPPPGAQAGEGRRAQQGAGGRIARMAPSRRT